jgi:hypothetical protein
MHVFWGCIVPKFERTLKAPPWGDSITEHITFVCWHLEQHPEILEQLFALCDQHRRRKPEGRISVQDAFAVLRWHSPVGARDDVFAINSNLTAVYSRLYLRERSEARALIDTRTSFLDSLKPGEWGLLDAALARGRAKLEARTQHD